MLNVFEYGCYDFDENRIERLGVGLGGIDVLLPSTFDSLEEDYYIVIREDLLCTRYKRINPGDGVDNSTLGVISSVRDMSEVLSKATGYMYVTIVNVVRDCVCISIGQVFGSKEKAYYEAGRVAERVEEYAGLISVLSGQYVENIFEK